VSAARAALLAVGIGAIAGPGLAQDALEAPETVVGVPRPDGSAAAPLTLNEVVEEALENNSQMQKFRLRDEELRGQGWRARATGLPSIDLTGTWNKTKDPTFAIILPPDLVDGNPGGDPTEIIPTYSLWRANFTGQWEVNPFLIYNAIGGVSVAQEQYSEDVEGAEYQLVEEAVRAFHEIVLHQERLDALDAEVEQRSEFLDVTRRRWELELTTPLDTLRAAVALANVTPVRRRVMKDLFNAAARLNNVMGRDANTPLTIHAEFDAERIPIDPAAATRVALQRPNIRSLELQIEFLRKQRGVFRADARPYVSAFGNYGWVGRNADNVISGETEFWDVGLAVTLPLFNGFETRGRVIETNATIVQTEKDLLSAQQDAKVEVATTLEELAAAWENYDAARLNLRAADSARQQTARRYDLGRASYLDFLNAQTDHLSAQSQTIEARYDVLVQSAALKRVLGFDPMTPLSRIREALEGNAP
jgi:outer membrane protein TolC